MAPQSVARGALRSRDRAAAGMPRPRLWYFGTPASRYGVASSSGRHCSALRGRIRVVAFRASQPAKPPSRQRRFVQRLLKISENGSAEGLRSGLLFILNPARRFPPGR